MAVDVITTTFDLGNNSFCNMSTQAYNYFLTVLAVRTVQNHSPFLLSDTVDL